MGEGTKALQSVATAATPKSRRLVNCNKVVRLVKAKLKHAELADQFMIYLCFSALYVAVIFAQRNGQNSQAMYQAIRGVFLDQTVWDPGSGEYKGFFDVVTLDDFWLWHERLFLPLAYQDQYYYGHGGPPMPDDQKYRILMHNRLAGGFRMMQRRMKQTDCLAGPSFTQFTGRCYSDAPWMVDTEPFFGADNKTIYTYNPQVGSQGGFYVQSFPRDLAAAREQLASLKANQWINRGTAYYVLDLKVYNGNLGLLGVVELRMVFAVTGRITLSFDASTIPAELYDGSLIAQLRQAAEVILTVWWGAYVVTTVLRALEAGAVARRPLAYLEDWGNIMKVVQLCLQGTLIGLWLAILTDPALTGMVVTADAVTAGAGAGGGNGGNGTGAGGPVDLSRLVRLQQAYFTLNGCNVLLTVFRMLAFLRINYTLSRITDTVALSRVPFMQFVIVLLSILFVFVLMGHLLFGQDLNNFASFNKALQTGWDTMTGAGDFWELYGVEPIAAWIWFVPFVLIMMLVVLNMVISVIMDGYDRVEEHRRQMREDQLGDLVDLNFGTQMIRGFMRRIWFLRRLVVAPVEDKDVPKKSILELLESVEDEEAFPISRINANLGDRNVTEETLNNIFDRYGGWVDEDELEKEGGGKNDPDAEEGKATRVHHHQEHIDRVLSELDTVHEQLRTVATEQKILEKKLLLLLQGLPFHQDIRVPGAPPPPPPRRGSVSPMGAGGG